MLSEDKRTQLDGIIQQMTDNNEADSDIQFVVSDFKGKYDTPDKPSLPGDKISTQPLSWGDVAKSAVTNTPNSAVDFAKNIVQPIIHPVDTLNSIRDIAFGGLGKIIPGADVGNQQAKFDAFKKALADRYGGVENIKRTIATDPVGSVADISTLLTGGGALVAKAPGLVGKIGTGAKIAGSAIDPINLTAKALTPVVGLGGKVVSGTTGFTTGAGKESVKKAYEAGLNNIPEFKQTLRDMPLEGLRVEAQGSLQSIKDARSLDYQNKLGNISQSTTDLNFKPVKDNLAQLELAYNIKRNKDGTFDFSRSTVDRNAVNDIETIINTVDEWGSQAGDLTPKGMDILKRKLDDFYSESKNSRGFVTSLKNKVKNTIVDQVPEYKTMLKNYEKTSNEITEIEKSLSLGNRTSIDTGLRKLMSALKDNNEFRGNLIQKLDEANQGQLATKLAAINLSSWTPNSLMGKGIDIAAIGSLFYGFSPQMAIALGTASPRVVGELAYRLGQGARHLEQVKQLAPLGARQAVQQIGRYTQ